MAEYKKRIIKNQRLIKKLKNFRHIWHFPGIYFIRKENKKMKILETVFHLPGFLSIRGKKMKIFNFFGETFPTSGVFIFCNNYTEGEIMTEAKKRILENQQLVKKLKIFEGIFRFPGVLPYVKGKQK